MADLSRARWDRLRAAYREVYDAADAQDRALSLKYGSGYRTQWVGASERKKLESLRAKRDKIGDKIIAMIVAISPRGEAWLTGAPAFWLRGELTWEDAIRPVGETLSVIVPAPWGADRGLT